MFIQEGDDVLFLKYKSFAVRNFYFVIVVVFASSYWNLFMSHLFSVSFCSVSFHVCSANQSPSYAQ